MTSGALPEVLVLETGDPYWLGGVTVVIPNL